MLEHQVPFDSHPKLQMTGFAGPTVGVPPIELVALHELARKNNALLTKATRELAVEPNASVIPVRAAGAAPADDAGQAISRSSETIDLWIVPAWGVSSSFGHSPPMLAGA